MKKQFLLNRFAAGLTVAVALLGASGSARAHDEAAATAPVPPGVEQPAVAAQGGMYCYAGPHPVDTRVAAGPAWDETQGTHSHTYAPFDLRLFALKDGCYHFVGDPRDFGYRGQTYSYYGAHPVLDLYGGGWCFMVGGHGHWWRPWSPYFVVAGPWYYWHGPYDHFFWAYWPYYATYYRHYYPRYYGGGSWRGAHARGGRGGGRGWTAAPPIGRVAAPPVRGTPSPAMGAATGMGPAPAPARPTWGAVPRSNDWSAWGRSSGQSGWTGTPSNGSFQSTPRRSDAPAFRSAPANPGFRATPPSSSWSGGGGGFRSAPASPLLGGGSSGGGGGRWRGR